jgi:CheY-like chemotaxis protein/HPt (histidine-containing phosphotransfer) domain-containing protein
LQEVTTVLAERYPLSILVVDDVEANRKLAVLMLKALGYSARLATNGREAIAAAQLGGCDLILMDVQMPEMDGFAATRAIAGALGESRPRIVGVTAVEVASGRAACLAAGMDDYLAKPFTLATLAEVILRAASATPGPDVSAHTESRPAAHADPIDWTRLDSLRPYDADGSMVREATAAFVRDAPAYFVAMLGAVSAMDGDALASAAHALKGAAGNVGARNLEAACQEVETLARAGQDPRTAKAISDCARELEEATRALKR